MSEEKHLDSETPAPEAPSIPAQADRTRQEKAPNLKWAATTFILGGIVSYYLCLGDNWGVPETYMVLGGYLLIVVGSLLAIFYERERKPLMSVLHRAYLLYGVCLLLGSALAALALAFGNVLVPIVLPYNLAPFAFYALIVTTLAISVEFGISVVKNFRK